ncbi:MAG: nicotinamide-nucleotide amidohydrolase family protein [bacterium]
MKAGDAKALEARLAEACVRRGLTVATAESCTGGLIAARITSVPGASAVFLGSVVSYANAAKRDLLGVSQDVLDRWGAVSAECAEAMAAGVRERLKADVAVSVTGIAGPDGGTPQKPAGLVFIGVATTAGVRVERCLFAGDREAVRRQAADRALALLLEAAQLVTR